MQHHASMKALPWHSPWPSWKFGKRSSESRCWSVIARPRSSKGWSWLKATSRSFRLVTELVMLSAIFWILPQYFRKETAFWNFRGIWVWRSWPILLMPLSLGSHRWQSRTMFLNIVGVVVVWSCVSTNISHFRRYYAPSNASAARL